jgi:hypothetical protein
MKVTVRRMAAEEGRRMVDDVGEGGCRRRRDGGWRRMMVTDGVSGY